MSSSVSCSTSMPLTSTLVSLKAGNYGDNPGELLFFHIPCHERLDTCQAITGHSDRFRFDPVEVSAMNLSGAKYKQYGKQLFHRSSLSTNFIKRVV